MNDGTNFALDGLYPGLVTTQSIASLGYLVSVVVISPVVRELGGGGWGPVPLGGHAENYRVTIRVKTGDRVYEETLIVDDNTARIVAKLNGISHFDENNVMVSVNQVQVFAPSQVFVDASLITSK
jgi:hypothetical protein